MECRWSTKKCKMIGYAWSTIIKMSWTWMAIAMTMVPSPFAPSLIMSRTRYDT
jgi:hypothetical protein